MPRVTHAQVLFLLARYARRHARGLVGMVFLSALSTALFLIQPFFYREAIDAIAEAQSPTREIFVFAIRQVVFGVLCAAVAFILEQGGALLLGKVEACIMRSVHADAFATVQRHATGFHVNEFAGATARKIGRGEDAVESLLDRIFLSFLPAFLLMLGFLVVLSIFAPVIGAALLGGIVLYLLLSGVLGMLLSRSYTWIDEQNTRISGNLVDVITANALVKSFAAEAREDTRHGALLKEWERRQIRTWTASTGVTLAQFLSLLLIELSVHILAVWLWFQGRFTPGSFIVLIFYIGQLWGRMWDIGRNMRDYMKAAAHCEEMIEVMERPPDVTDALGAMPLRVQRGEITFEHVSFRYERQSRLVFEDFSVSVRPGETVALVGHSGGGKSTFVKLLLRLYDVTGGCIRIDGQDIGRVTQESLRGSIALVPQDPLLFHRSIAENIAYGRPGAFMAEIERAARLAHAEEFIVRIETGYETLVGERGVKLSGGERQRIAIARAILADRPILVLDEATSSLDSLSETYIQEALVSLMEGRTTVAIAHRLSTIKRADRILVIEHGRIVEEGSHADLLARAGVYRQLYDLQAGGFIGE